MSKYISLENRLIEYSIAVIKFTKSLLKDDAGRYLSNQLIRSSSSSALNYGEARDAESKKDFIHKMKISLKELRESYINLKIIEGINITKKDEVLEYLIDETNQLISIFVKSVHTASKK